LRVRGICVCLWQRTPSHPPYRRVRRTCCS
jgi:hypothetical protein